MEFFCFSICTTFFKQKKVLYTVLSWYESTRCFHSLFMIRQQLRMKNVTKKMLINLGMNEINLEIDCGLGVPS